MNPFDAPRDPSFPPLYEPQAVEGATDPFDKACSMAALGCNSGVLTHAITPEKLRAAIVFAPEMPLEQAMQAFCACGTGFQNAFGALAPPEVGLHLTWDGDILVNGACCGHLKVAASHDAPDAHPDWLVIGLEVWLMPQNQDEPGLTPDQTCLYLEGCAEVSPLDLLEGWARHTLVWVNALINNEIEPLHAEWRELLYGIGSEVTISLAGLPITGTFVGADEGFGMLMRDGADTRLIPLTDLLKQGVTP